MVILMDHEEIRIFDNTKKLFEFAALDFAQRIQAYVHKQGVASVVLAGGNTPSAFYHALVEIKDQIPWQNIRFFYGDERYVPQDNPKNNHFQANLNLFSHVPVNHQWIYPIPTQHSVSDSVKDYTAKLIEIFHLKTNEVPVFDLVYLGLGDNAHTASLMPGTQIVQDYANNTFVAPQKYGWVTHLYDSVSGLERITLTPIVFNQSQHIVFMVTGVTKAPAVWQVLKGQRDPLRYPAQLIRNAHHRMIWLLDRDAALRLEESL